VLGRRLVLHLGTRHVLLRSSTASLSLPPSVPRARARSLSLSLGMRLVLLWKSKTGRRKGAVLVKAGEPG
jgi:hypothetical protein